MQVESYCLVVGIDDVVSQEILVYLCMCFQFFVSGCGYECGNSDSFSFEEG